MADDPPNIGADLWAIHERLTKDNDEAAEPDADGDDWDELIPGVSAQRTKPWRIEPPTLPKFHLPNFDNQREGITKELREATEGMRQAQREKVAREEDTLAATEAVAAELRRANENDETTARRDRWMVGLTALSCFAGVVAVVVSIALH